MSLIYRTMWEDDRPDIADVALHTFRSWAREKSLDALSVPDTGTETSPDQDVRIVRVSTPAADALIMTHHHRLPSGTWTLSCRSIVGEQRWVWVDVERTADDPFGPRPQIVAPRIVQRLIEDGHANVAGIRLRTRPVLVAREAVDGLARLVLTPRRQVPLVVFSFDTTLTTSAWNERLTTVARHLAGLALVVGLEPDTDKLLEAQLPDGLGVFGGAVRTYIPGDTDAMALPWRHRWLGAAKLRGPAEQVAQTLANQLASSATLQRPPDLYETHIRPVLWQSDQHAATSVDLERELEATRRRVETLERSRVDLGDDLAVHLLERARSAWVWAEGTDANVEDPAPPVDPRWSAPDIALVLECAERALPRVELAPPDPATVAHLEAGPAAEARLLRVWLALVALEAFGRTQPRPDTFREWCGLDVRNAWDPALVTESTDDRGGGRRFALRLSRSDDDAGVSLHCLAHPDGRTSVVLDTPVEQAPTS